MPFPLSFLPVVFLLFVIYYSLPSFILQSLSFPLFILPAIHSFFPPPRYISCFFYLVLLPFSFPFLYTFSLYPFISFVFKRVSSSFLHSLYPLFFLLLILTCNPLLFFILFPLFILSFLLPLLPVSPTPFYCPLSRLFH